MQRTRTEFEKLVADALAVHEKYGLYRDLIVTLIETSARARQCGSVDQHAEEELEETIETVLSVR